MVLQPQLSYTETMSNTPFSDSSAKTDLPASDVPVSMAGNATPEAKGESKTFLQRYGLQLGGGLNLVGDVALLKAGIDSGNRLMTLAGGLYTAGALALARYGKPSKERQNRDISESAAEFLKQKTGALPKDSGLAHVLEQQDNSLLGKIERPLYRRPVDAMLGLYTAGAGAMLASGVKSGNKWRIGYGSWSLFVKAASFLMPEKATDAEEKKNAKGGVIGWIKEKPLRLFGYGSIVTELLLGKSALNDLKNKEPGAKFTLAAGGLYVLSDILMAISSKNTASVDGKLKDADQNRIEDMVAETIATQPKEKQDTLIGEVSRFLVKKSGVKGTATEVGDAISKRVAARQKDWVSRAEATEETTPALQR